MAEKDNINSDLHYLNLLSLFYYVLGGILMKRNKIRKHFFGFVLLLLILGVEGLSSESGKSHGTAASQKWRESRGLVALWPKVQKETIESITFCSATAEELFTRCSNEYKEFPEENSFRLRSDKDIKTWPVKYSVPKANLPECIQIIDKAIENPSVCLCGLEERMLITTNKGKYIVWVFTEIKDTNRPVVSGEDWGGVELGRFIAKYCCPDYDYKYSIPLKKDIIAIMLYPREYSGPLAFWGDKKLAEKLIFDPNVTENPNGVRGIADLYRFGRVKTFGTEVREEKGKYVWDKELKAKKTFEGRQWLEKIMDAFETAIKEAEEKEKYYPGSTIPFNAKIVFMTRDSECWKEIVIGKSDVCDDYIKSEQLKAYFDQLGLTKDLLSGTSNSTK
jgi:hypothetical protein